MKSSEFNAGASRRGEEIIVLDRLRAPIVIEPRSAKVDGITTKPDEGDIYSAGRDIAGRVDAPSTSS